jgi:serine/threonine protein kinase
MYGEIITNQHIHPYSPKKFKDYESKYVLTQQLYENPLAATKIYIANDKSNASFAIKEIKKEKLKDSFNFELARNELSIHYSLSKKSSYIVSVPEYFESEQSYIMVMECCNNPNYFQHRLETVQAIIYLEAKTVR